MLILLIKSIIEREATLENSSDREVTVTQKNSLSALVKYRQ